MDWQRESIGRTPLSKGETSGLREVERQMFGCRRAGRGWKPTGGGELADRGLSRWGGSSCCGGKSQ